MATYLRFTRQEFQAISQVHALLDASDDLPAFQTLLVLSLSPRFPALADHIARLHQSHIRIIYDHLQAERPPRERLSQGTAAGCAGQGPHLTGEEGEIITWAAGFLWLHDECRPSFKECLVRLVGESSPALAGRLARLSDHEVEALCLRVRVRGSRGA
jgi:hypothetical protein